MTDWPTCSRCGRSILLHHMWGLYAYCSSARTKQNQASFTVAQVNDVHRTLGHKLNRTSIEAEAKEREIEGQAKIDLA